MCTYRIVAKHILFSLTTCTDDCIVLYTQFSSYGKPECLSLQSVPLLIHFPEPFRVLQTRNFSATFYMDLFPVFTLEDILCKIILPRPQLNVNSVKEALFQRENHIPLASQVVYLPLKENIWSIRDSFPSQLKQYEIKRLGANFPRSNFHYLHLIPYSVPYPSLNGFSGPFSGA